MNQPGAVHRRHSAAHVPHDFQLARKSEGRLLSNELLERLADEVFHRDEGLMVVLADIEDRDRIGVVDAGGGARFVQQPVARSFTVGLFAQELDRHLPAQAGIARQVQVAHASCAQALQNLVRADLNGV